MPEGDLIAYCAREKKSGEEVELTIFSEAERLTVKLSLD